MDKHPRPWRFEQTDRDDGPSAGGGVLLDANGQLLMWLVGDTEWSDSIIETDPRWQPVFNNPEERPALIDFMLACING